jgi:hypothetical protein
LFPTSVNESPKINVTSEAADANVVAFAARMKAAKASPSIAIVCQSSLACACFRSGESLAWIYTGFSAISTACLVMPSSSSFQVLGD